MSILSPLTDFLSIGPTRSFAGFNGYVTIEESTTDVLEITQQPVQQGASIADHAFKKPVSLSIQIQMSTALNIPGIGGLAGGILSTFGITKSLKQIYADLLKLQVPDENGDLNPFTVNTLKRTYSNMLLTSLGLITNKSTENVLAINAVFQEVILVPIGSTTTPRNLLKTPGSNGATQAIGNKSFIKQIFNGITGKG